MCWVLMPRSPANPAARASRGLVEKRVYCRRFASSIRLKSKLSPPIRSSAGRHNVRVARNGLSDGMVRSEARRGRLAHCESAAGITEPAEQLVNVVGGPDDPGQALEAPCACRGPAQSASQDVADAAIPY